MVSKKLEHGHEIQKLILTNDELMIDKAYVLLHSEMYRYKNGYFKKWMCLAFGLVLSSVFILPTIYLLQTLLFAKYDRSGMEDVARDEFTTTTFDQLAVDELLIPSFEFNQNEPRFYSKYFREKDPGIYDLPIWEAVAASSSAPIYFDPMTRMNGYGFKARLIDGGIICNNPSLYAFMYAKYLKGHTNIRLISLGTGTTPDMELDKVKKDSEKEDVFKMSAFRALANFDWLMNFDSVTADKVLLSVMKG